MTETGMHTEAAGPEEISVALRNFVWQGIAIQSRATDNFVNATQMCRAGGKLFADWYRLGSTKELIKTLENSTNSHAGIPACELVELNKGGKWKGSWIHPDLAVQLAQWIAPAFGLALARWMAADRDPSIQPQPAAASRSAEAPSIQPDGRGSNASLAWEGVVIESRASDHFVNATQMCRAGGKRFKDWYRLDSTKKLIETLENDLKSNGHICPLETTIDSRVGGDHQGSWIHPDLAVQLAQWISPAFGLQVSRWVRELFATGSVSIDSRKTDAELRALEERLLLAEREKQQLAAEMKAEKEKSHRLHTVNAELLTYKKLLERNETIYITSTSTYAAQGLFKIGRTKNIKSRAVGHNTTHPTGDKMKVLAEFKVNNATLMEAALHGKLKGLRPSADSEFFMCPFGDLRAIVEEFTSADDALNSRVNELIEKVYRIKQDGAQATDWTAGLDMSVFGGNATEGDGGLRLVTYGGEVKADISYAGLSDEAKQEIITTCLAAFRAGEERKQQAPVPEVFRFAWTDFQASLVQMLIEKFGIKKSEFKATGWRDIMKQVMRRQQHALAIAWHKKEK